MQIMEKMRQIHRISVFSCSFSLLSTLARTSAFTLRSQRDFLQEKKSNQFLSRISLYTQLSVKKVCNPSLGCSYITLELLL